MRMRLICIELMWLCGELGTLAIWRARHAGRGGDAHARGAGVGGREAKSY